MAGQAVSLPGLNHWIPTVAPYAAVRVVRGPRIAHLKVLLIALDTTLEGDDVRRVQQRW